MMPSTTTGVTCRPRAFGIVNTHFGARRATLRLVDLRERRVAVAAGIAVVGGPTGLGRDLSKAIARASQQVHALVVGPQLQVVEPFAEHLAVEGPAVGRLNRSAAPPGFGAALDRAQELRRRSAISGSATGSEASPRPESPSRISAGELPVVACRQAQPDGRAHLAAVAVAAVASGAAEYPRRSHDVVDRGHRHEDEADAEQHLIEMASGVEVTIERALQHRADQGACDKRQRQACKERPAGLIDQHRADISARHRKRAMGEIDEVHQPERDRKPAGEHEQQHAVGDAVEQDGEQRGHLGSHWHKTKSPSPGSLRDTTLPARARALAQKHAFYRHVAQTRLPHRSTPSPRAWEGRPAPLAGRGGGSEPTDLTSWSCRRP